jgi:hypothetical protein
VLTFETGISSASEWYLAALSSAHVFIASIISTMPTSPSLNELTQLQTALRSTAIDSMLDVAAPCSATSNWRVVSLVMCDFAVALATSRSDIDASNWLFAIYLEASEGGGHLLTEGR